MIRLHALILVVILWIIVTLLSCNSTPEQISSTKEVLNSTDAPFSACGKLALHSQRVLCYHKAIKHYKSNQNYEKLVHNHSYLMNEYNNVNLLDSAQHFADKAYDLAEQFDIDTLSNVYATATYNKALMFERKNQFEKSEQFYKKTLAIDIHNKSELISHTYNGIGHIFRRKGDFENAKLYFNQAVDNETVKKALIPFLYDLGYLHSKYDNTNLASSYYRKSLELFERYGDTKDKFYLQTAFNDYNGLAELAISTKQLDSANYYLDKAEIIKQKYDTLLSKLYFTNLLRGKLAAEEKKIDEALTYFEHSEQEAINEFKSIGKDEVTIPFKEKALLFLQLGKHKQALTSIQKAIHFVSKSFESSDPYQHPEITDIFSKHTAIELLGIKAQIFNSYYKQTKEQKQLFASTNTYQYIHKLIPVARQIVVEDASKFNLAKQTSTIYQQAIATTIELYKQTKNKQHIETTLQFIEGNKTTALLENMKHNQAFDNGNIPAEKQRAISYLKAEIDLYEKEARTAKSEQKQRFENLIFNSKQQYQQQLKDLEQQYPEYYAIKYDNQPISLKQIQQTLEKDAVLLEYFLADNQIYLLRISATDTDIITIDKRPSFDEDVLHLLSIITDRAATAAGGYSYYNLAHRLYSDLLGQAKLNLKTTNQLIIIPDGQLSQLPFGSLLTNQVQPNKAVPYFSKEHLPYLIEETAISYHYSAKLMLETATRNQSVASKLFLGIAPESQLTSTKKEVEQIKRLLKSGALLLGNAATKTGVQQSVARYRILHFAAHAKQDKRNPKFNEIELFGTDKLTSSDIESMRINADLTVLSACETGVGKLQAGEGVLSLARSFFIAGSPSLVASLWKVDDLATGQLMTGFYEGLTEGRRKSVAIRQSKLGYLSLHKDSKSRSHPFYWSGLVVIGRDGAIGF